MAKMILTTSYIAINSVDYSDHCKKIELVTQVDDKEVTTFASLGWKEYLGGLKAGTLSVSFFNDYAAANIDSQIWALFGTVTTFETRPTSSAVGAANPKWTGSILIKEWKPISGSVGDVASVDVSYPTSGAVARATS